VQASNPSPLPAVPVRPGDEEALAGAAPADGETPADGAAPADEALASLDVLGELAEAELEELVLAVVCFPLARMERIWESSVPYVAVTRTPGPGASTWIS
jgi:hypothetical protein